MQEFEIDWINAGGIPMDSKNGKAHRMNAFKRQQEKAVSRYFSEIEPYEYIISLNEPCWSDVSNLSSLASKPDTYARKGTFQ